MKRQQWRFYGGLIALFLIVELSLILAFDREFSLALREVDTANPALIDFFRAYTDLGKGKWYSIISAVGAALCAVTYHKIPRLRDAALWLGQSFAYFFVAVTGAGLTADILKLLFGRARPKLLKEENFYGFHPFNLTSADWRSFPSGHSTTIFAVATALSLLFPRTRWPLIILAIAVSLSRVMINAHYAADVVAGALLGTIFALATACLFSRRGWVFRPGTLTLAETGQRLCRHISTYTRTRPSVRPPP